MGAIFKVPGMILYFVGGIWGLFVCLRIIYESVGWLGTIVALVVLPFTLYLAPIWAGISDGDWFPALLVYGTSVVSLVLVGIGVTIDRD